MDGSRNRCCCLIDNPLKMKGIKFTSRSHFQSVGWAFSESSDASIVVKVVYCRKLGIRTGVGLGSASTTRITLSTRSLESLGKNETPFQRCQKGSRSEYMVRNSSFQG